MTNQATSNGTTLNQLFYDEVLELHDNLSEIDFHYGPNTLATMFYFQHALVVDGFIDVWDEFHDGFVVMIDSLPSAELYKKHIRDMERSPRPRM